MAKLLTVDIGTGTQDVLLFDSRTSIENSYRLILPSPTLIIRRRIQAVACTMQDLLLTGSLMGGGPSGWAVEDVLKAGCRVYATEDAARTLDDDLERVAELGVILVSNEEAARLPKEIKRIQFGDFDYSLLEHTFKAYGVRLDDLDVVAVAVFDHGNAPRGISDRKFRFEYLRERVLQENRLSAFAYPGDKIPPMLTRMQAVADSARDLPCPLLLMDTAPAAVLGATFDPLVNAQPHRLIVNLGNMHTLAFRLGEYGIEGIFEHHTPLLTPEKLEEFLHKFLQGTLTNAEVYGSQGHGAFLRNTIPWEMNNPGFRVTVTGPQRGLLRASRLPLHYAAPFGDMMLSGCYGLLSAAADHFPHLAAEIHAALSSIEQKQVSPWDID